MTIHTTRRPTRRRSALKAIVPLVALGLLATACGSDDDAGSSNAGSSNTGSSNAGAVDGPTIRLRGQDFSESATITEVYGQYLDAKGYDIEILTPAGFRTEALDGIDNGDFELTIDYIGGTMTALAPDEIAGADPAAVAAIIAPALEGIGATLLDVSPAVDGDALVVRGDSEAASISDLAGLDYRLGASAQCPERPQCLIGFEDPDVYGITFKDFVTLEFGPLLGQALANNEVDVVMWNTTAPQITAEGFKVLDDDKGLFPAQNIAPIISTEVLDAYGAQLAADINALSAVITTDDLLAWNTQTDIENRESDDVATEWLESKGLI